MQNEYSLWTHYPDLGTLQTCRELGVTFVPFSPPARGLLKDTVLVLKNLEENDFRKNMPRFMEPNFSMNCRLITNFTEFARSRGWSTTAAALA